MKIVGMIGFLLFCSLPLLICSFLVYRWRGGWRIAAAVPLVVVIPVLVTEINSGLHGGNLTGVMTIISSGPVLLYLLILAIINSVAQRPQHSQGRVVTYINAVLSFLFVSGGILFVWYGILLLPFAIELSRIGMVLYWIIGSALALSAAVYSFRAAVKPLRATGEPVDSTREFSERDGASSAARLHDESS